MEGPQDAQAVLGEPALRLPLGLTAPGAGFSWGGCLLGVAQVAAALAALLLPVGWQRGLLLAAVGLWWGWRLWRSRRPAPVPEPPAWLLLYPDRLELQTAGQQQVYPLDATTRVRLVYDGYRGEAMAMSYGNHNRASTHSGHHNTIQLNGGAEYPFFVADQAAEEALRRQLRHWYARRVDLHEYRLGQRTVLLRAEPDYDEQMQLLRDYGFSLYGRSKP